MNFSINARFFLDILVVYILSVFLIEQKLHAQQTALNEIPQIVAQPTHIKLAARSKKSRRTPREASEGSSSDSVRSTPKAEVGGYLSYASVNQETKTEKDSESESGSAITVSANYLMILQEKYAIGPTLTYTSSSQGKTENSSYGIGATAKFYFADLKERLIPFASLTLQISGRSQTFTATDPTTGESTTDTSSGSGFGFAGGGGIHYMLRKSVSLTPELQYYSNSTSASGVTFKESGIRLLAGFVIFL